MEATSSESRRNILIVTIAAIALSVMTGLAFAAWSEKSAEIFIALTQSGLNWCL